MYRQLHYRYNMSMNALNDSFMALIRLKFEQLHI